MQLYKCSASSVNWPGTLPADVPYRALRQWLSLNSLSPRVSRRSQYGRDQEKQAKQNRQSQLPALSVFLLGNRELQRFACFEYRALGSGNCNLLFGSGIDSLALFPLFHLKGTKSSQLHFSPLARASVMASNTALTTFSPSFLVISAF